MAIIVEDGTGLDTAESYASVAEFEDYCTARGYDYSSLDSTGIEQKLRMAADYIDSRWRFKGSRLTEDQALEFPRDGLLDWSSREVTGIPRRLKNAQCELAFKGISDAAFFVDNDKIGIQSEKVGPLETTYAKDASSAGGSISKEYEGIRSMLAQYLRDPRQITGVPHSGTQSTTAIFTVGMHDYSTSDE